MYHDLGDINYCKEWDRMGEKKRKPIRSDNDASEVIIFGHFGTFWDNLEDFLMSLKHLDCFPSHFQPFSLIVGSLKKTRYRPTDRPTVRHTDEQTDPHA